MLELQTWDQTLFFTTYEFHFFIFPESITISNKQLSILRERKWRISSCLKGRLLLRFPCFGTRKSAGNFQIRVHILDSANESHPNESHLIVEYVRGLTEIAREEELAELEVEREGVRISLRAPEIYPSASTPLGNGAPQFAPAALSASANLNAAIAATTSAASTPAARDENLIEIVSPMVGVFYRAPSPSDPNFVEVGDKVEVGQTVALVEAMKVFNEITSEVSGVVVEIKAAGSDLVETGQVLLTLRK